MHYGPGLSYYSPTFERPINVQDGVAATLRARRLKKWRNARAMALSLWEEAGISFTVEEVGGLVVTGIGEPDWPGSSSEMTQHSVPGRITLVRSVYTPDPPKFWPHAWSYAYASYYNVPRILRQTDPFYDLGRTICHEVGHNLGLAHGGNGIMSGGIVPNQHDLDSVKEYYK